MKHDKHITINITAEEFQALELIAQAEERTLSAAARRFVISGLMQNLALLTDKGSTFKALK